MALKMERLKTSTTFIHTRFYNKLCNNEIEKGPNVMVHISSYGLFCLFIFIFSSVYNVEYKTLFTQLTKCLPIRAYTFELRVYCLMTWFEYSM